MINWVLRAMRAEKSVGSPTASSKGVGVQRLRAAQHGRQGLHRGADDVVVRVLRGQAPARGLHVGAQHGRARFLGLKRLHQLVPQKRAARSMAISMKKFMPTPKKKESRGAKGIDVQAGLEGRAHVLQAIGQGKGQLQHGGGAGLHHVIAADADRVERGMFAEQWAMMSATMRMEGTGG
jgi:hypothetical protein